MKSIFYIILSILCSRGYSYPHSHYQYSNEPQKGIASFNSVRSLIPHQELGRLRFPEKRFDGEDLDLKTIMEKSDNWSPEFFRMLKNMKKEGRTIKLKSEQEDDLNTPHTPNSVICKMEPYNTCYQVAPNGDILLSSVQQRPMRLLRIY